MKLPEPVGVITGKLGDHCSFMSNVMRKGDTVYSESQVKELLAQADSMLIAHMNGADQMRKRYESVLKQAMEALGGVK